VQKKYLALLSSLLVVLVLSEFLTVANAETHADNKPPIEVGDVLKIESRRGIAVELKVGREENSERELLKAELMLKVEVAEIKDARVALKVLEGYIKIGENVYTVKEGKGRAILSKFGWLGVGGTATNEGAQYRFYLEGMLHIERSGLVVARLTGVFGNDEKSYRLRIMARIEKSD